MVNCRPPLPPHAPGPRQLPQGLHQVPPSLVLSLAALLAATAGPLPCSARPSPAPRSLGFGQSLCLRPVAPVVSPAPPGESGAPPPGAPCPSSLPRRGPTTAPHFLWPLPWALACWAHRESPGRGGKGWPLGLGPLEGSKSPAVGHGPRTEQAQCGPRSETKPATAASARPMTGVSHRHRCTLGHGPPEEIPLPLLVPALEPQDPALRGL